ncbi:MAG: hypothetical protein SPG64_02370 [Candidatus Enteromonas sp.]|nr:hypothetical protein [Candidatus Enteromonas sp.]
MSNQAYTELLATLANEGFRLSPIDSDEEEHAEEDETANEASF